MTREELHQRINQCRAHMLEYELLGEEDMARIAERRMNDLLDMLNEEQAA